ncbi:MAG: NmrA family NAD(P)-binding protein, partial [Polyangiales bacterium]
GAEVAVASLDDPSALTKALAGAEGAYLLLPPQPESTDSYADNARRAEGYAKAIDASGVKHVVFLSSIGAQLPSGTGPIVSVHDGEKTLSKTRAALTFVRAAYFMENWASSLFALEQGVLPTFLTPGKPAPMIAAKDIGTTAAKALLEGGHGRTVIELAGPRDYTPEDVAAALSRVTGKPITLQQGPEDAIAAALMGAGLNAHWAELYREMIVGFNHGNVPWERGAAREVRGKTEIDEVLRQLVGK